MTQKNRNPILQSNIKASVVSPKQIVGFITGKTIFNCIVVPWSGRGGVLVVCLSYLV